MIDVHVVTAANRIFYKELMEEYHRRRYEVFVEERGWRNLRCVEGGEFDEYDDDFAVYLVASEGNRVLGGQRLYPSVRPHLLSDVFAYLVRGPVPQDTETWECTRYFVSRDARGRRVEARLIVALQQFCTEEGIAGITGVMEVANVSARMQAGLRIRPLGLPHDVDGHPTIAVLVEMTEEGLRDSLERLGARALPLVRQNVSIGSIGLAAHEAAL